MATDRRAQAGDVATCVAFADPQSKSFPFQLHSFQKIATSANQYNSRNDLKQGCLTPSSVVDDDLRDCHSWVVTEKVHGAQLQLHCGLIFGKTSQEPDLPWMPASAATLVVAAAKRSGWLRPYESFYGYQEVVRKLAPALRHVIDLLMRRRQQKEELRYIVFYGELCGGWYPSDAEADSWKGYGSLDSSKRRSRPVQEGIYYSSRHEFLVFDIAVVAANHDPIYLPWHQLAHLCQSTRTLTGVMPLCHVPVLCTAESYEAAASSGPLAFDSKVPAMLTKTYATLQQELDGHEYSALAALPSGSNTAEGFVVRPDGGALHVTYKGSSARALVKHKHPTFAEVEHIERPEEEEAATVMVGRVFQACLTVNRINAVRSKLSEEEALDIEGGLLEALVTDIMADFWEVAPLENQRAYHLLSDDEIAILETDLRRSSMGLLRHTIAAGDREPH
mmetsp:Transcript_38892/g.91586  ORF Transcript_38892/g.91586 Transcript_38892/m.91586 type:complete len:448 (+) Transcript_38892:87-1430(+)